MQLKTIKLIGFKSFVDAQLLELPARITAIVGPNGCGKSNVIDAVKWVIGESHAKQLRGDSMTDVIFNGSTQRKPVGQAHVELTFDNSLGILKGAFSHYQEVTVKRVIGRDAQSVYAINQTRCRRKDVVDLFTGTGLGARSYAIIEQGMIHRFIEAKPAELRGYLEEAAGISRYYEKRKETVAHLAHTTENLIRIKDLEEELKKRCVILEKQAQEVVRYQTLREECVQSKQHYFSALYRQSMHDDQTCMLAMSAQQTNSQALEKIYLAFQAQLFALEKKKEWSQERYNTSKDALHQKIQERQQYQHQCDQSVLQKQWITTKHKEMSESQSVLKQRIAMLTERIQSDTKSDVGCDPNIEHVEHMLQKCMKEWAALEVLVTTLDRSVQDKERAYHEASHRYEALCVQNKNHMQHRNHKKDSLTNLEKEKESLEKKIEESNCMAHEVAFAAVQTDREEQKAVLEAQKILLKTCEEQLHIARTQIAVCDHDLKTETQRIHVLNQQIQAYHKRTSSWLNPTQQAHLVTLQTWKSTEGLEDYLACVPTQFLYQGAQSVTAEQLQQQADCDLEYVWGSDKPTYWSNYIMIDSVEEALQTLNRLDDHQAYLIPEGGLVGKNWARPWRKRAPILPQLLQEHKGLEEQIVTHQAQHAILGQQIQTYGVERLRLEHCVDQGIQTIEALQKKSQKHLLEIERLKQAQKDLLERQKWNAQQMEQCVITIARLENECLQSQEQSQGIALTLQAHKEDCVQLEKERDQMKLQYHNKMQEKDRCVAQRHESLRARDVQRLQHEQNVQQSLQAQTQYDEAVISLESYQKELEVIEHKNQHDQMLVAQHDPQIVQNQEALQQLHHDLQDIQKSLQSDQTLLKQHETSYAQSRSALQSLQIQKEKILLTQAHLNEQILDQGWIVEALLCLETDQSVGDLKKQIARLEAQIQTMGGVNLKALQEFDVQSLRYQESVTQRSDLEAAMEALNQAISVLDQDMKHLFDTTFMKLKTHFETLFPILFDGGYGTLSLESDPVSGAQGMIIHAQPPGKKNTRLSILSGGEKALTAAALVFSFFQLNPAPFCLLDEIDAPLDDANTQRLGTMIASLKDRIQFIIVTHSKVMMEYADSLYGVTMKEPGVSKFVSVNLVEALDSIEALA